MRIKDIKIGEIYVLKDQIKYTFIRPVEILKPMQNENTNSYTVVKCEHFLHKDDTCGLIKYFKPCDICELK